MSTIKGRTYSSPKNINLKQGILRFDVSKTSNPLSNDSTGWGLYVNSSNQLVFWNKTSTTVLASGGAGSVPTWETLFGADNTFTVTPDATFTIAGNRATATDVLTITNIGGGSGDCLQITNSGTGNDISGTSGLFTVTKAGVISGRGLTFGAASTITSTAGDITWTLEDNDATALKIGSSGATSIMNFITTDGSEAVVFGNNMTLTDGKFTGTSTSNTVPMFLLKNNTVTTYGSDSSEDSGVFVLSSTSLTTGDLLRLQLDESSLVGGYFLKCTEVDADAAVFTIGEKGATTIAGVASGTAALTLTAGDLVITSGTATLTAGGLTLTLGDLTLTAGNIVQTLGDLTLTAGNFTMTTGDASIADGSLAIVDADQAASFSVTNNTATTAPVIVLAGSGVRSGATTNAFMTITPSGMTTGTGIYAPMAALTEGKGIELITNALTSGQALLVSSSATAIATTGRLLSVVHSGATGTSAVLSEFSSAANDETTILKITASAALAAGKALHISASAMTTGTAIYVNATEATLTTGKYLEFYDGAANDFSVAKYGATVIAGNASGTAVLTLTAGDLVITSGHTIMTAGNLTLTAGNIVQTLGNLTLTSGNLLLTSGTLTMTAGSATLTAGNLILTAGTIITTPQAIVNANTAISVTHGVTTIANNGVSTHTLADGVVGQKKTIVCTVYTGDATITPDNLANGTTVTLNAVGDACDLVFLGTEWWVTNLYGTCALA
jgi:putative membrane protein